MNFKVKTYNAIAETGLSLLKDSDFEISDDVALKVFADVGITFEETFAITIKHINKIAKPFVRFIFSWDHWNCCWVFNFKSICNRKF